MPRVPKPSRRSQTEVGGGLPPVEHGLTNDAIGPVCRQAFGLPTFRCEMRSELLQRKHWRADGAEHPSDFLRSASVVERTSGAVGVCGRSSKGPAVHEDTGDTLGACLTTTTDHS
jgi:hypothetical protein